MDLIGLISVCSFSQNFVCFFSHSLDRIAVRIRHLWVNLQQFNLMNHILLRFYTELNERFDRRSKRRIKRAQHPIRLMPCTHSNRIGKINKHFNTHSDRERIRENGNFIHDAPLIGWWHRFPYDLFIKLQFVCTHITHMNFGKIRQTILSVFANYSSILFTFSLSYF